MARRPGWHTLIWPVVALIATAITLPACQKAEEKSAPPAAVVTPPTSPAITDGPPPEQYAKLPPGAFKDQPPAAATEGTDQPSAGAAPSAAQPPDRSVLPNAGDYDLTGVHLGMDSADVYGRYPPDSGWSYDKHFIPEALTGILLAKPNDARARATEMFTLQDGTTVAFMRAVQEDSQAFLTTAGELEHSFGPAEAKPPQWARRYKLFQSWHSTANEESRFWSNEEKQQVLTAGHSADGAETVYMLLDLPRLEQVQAAMATANVIPPPTPDNSWNPPPGAQVH